MGRRRTRGLSGGRYGSATLVRAVSLFAPHRRRVAIWAAVTLCSALLLAAAPLLIAVIFDKALFPAGGQPDLGLLVTLVALMIGAVALGGALAILQTYLANLIGQQVLHDLRLQLYLHLRQMSLGFFTSARSGALQSAVARDVEGLGPVVTEGASVVLGNAVFVLATVAGMAYLSWPLTLVSLVIVPAFVLAGRRVGVVSRRLSSSEQEALSELSVISEETLSVSGALLTKMFDRESSAASRYVLESERLANLRLRREMAGRVFLGLSQTFFLAAPAILYLAAGVVLDKHSGLSLTPGQLVAFTVLQTRMFFPLRDLLGTWVQVQASMPIFARIFEYLDLPHDVHDSPRALPLEKDRVRGAVELRNVFFRYGPDAPEGRGPSERWTLEDVSLSIGPGQLAALVGPSGAGKTTLAYLVPRLYDVASGSVAIDGTDVREIRLDSLAEIVGMVTQETYLLHATVRQNLRLAKPGASEEELEHAARAAFIHDRILELPDGYDTVVGDRGHRLSGGERQRLAIARVVLKDPRVLILDEATSALDTLSERLVQQAMASLVAGRTTIAIAHRLSTVLAADVIFVLDGGRLVEHGSHAELLKGGGLYARLYEEQFQRAAFPSTPARSSAARSPTAT
jgi:ATP-binding cassette subfamily B protein